MTFQWLDCDCRHPDHALRFVWDEEDRELYTELSIRSYLSFWKRLGAAIRYVFWAVPRDHWDCWTIHREEDLGRLKEFVGRL